MNLPTIPVPVFSSFFRPGVFIKGMALAGALVSGAPAFSSTVHFFDDPEPMQVHYLPDGRVSFAKVGAYEGPMKGGRCNQTAMKDMKHDRVEPVCKPLSVNVPQGVSAPDTHFPMTVDSRSSDAFGYREAHSLSAGLIGEVMAVAPTSYALPLATQLVALNFKPAGVGTTRRHQPSEGPVAQVQTPVIPLPATAWLMLAGLAMLWRFRNG